MKLFLTSDTITLNLIPAFQQLIGHKVDSLKTAFIPDAGYTPAIKNKTWIQEEKQYLVDTLKWQVDTFELAKHSPESIEKLFEYQVIFVNGGFSGYLANEFRRTNFDKILPKLFEKGIVYVGSSAGSMVMSDVQEASSWYIGEPEPEAIDIPGLGYIDFQIYPHVTDALVPKIIKSRNLDLKYFLLRDSQAITVTNEKTILHGQDIIFLDQVQTTQPIIN